MILKSLVLATTMATSQGASAYKLVSNEEVKSSIIQGVVSHKNSKKLISKHKGELDSFPHDAIISSSYTTTSKIKSYKSKIASKNSASEQYYLESVNIQKTHGWNISDTAKSIYDRYGKIEKDAANNKLNDKYYPEILSGISNNGWSNSDADSKFSGAVVTISIKNRITKKWHHFK